MDLRNSADHNDRRKQVEEHLQIALETVGIVFKDEVSRVHCENLIGAVTIPLGVAGPLKIQKLSDIQESYIPLATTEGALVASVNRGCKAIAQSRGVIIEIEEKGATRGPVFRTRGIREGHNLKHWIEQNMALLQKEAASTSTHLHLQKTDITINGTEVYVRFYYDTGDAMGMNMVTIATNKIVPLIEQATGAKCIAVAGNFDIDKKPAWLNSISGRGKSGWAEVIIPAEVVQSVLKTTAANIEEVVRSKCWGGSMLSGSLGFNAHFANIVAAFFAATGQDLAHVVEGSQGVTSARVLENGSLYFAIYMPSIMIGSVGGGTKLKTQTEARTITKTGTALELTEILLGSVLAGELSLIASISEHSLAKAHSILGRS